MKLRKGNKGQFEDFDSIGSKIREEKSQYKQKSRKIFRDFTVWF